MAHWSEISIMISSMGKTLTQICKLVYMISLSTMQHYKTAPMLTKEEWLCMIRISSMMISNPVPVMVVVAEVDPPVAGLLAGEDVDAVTDEVVQFLL
jgi:hypothetical protein